MRKKKRGLGLWIALIVGISILLIAKTVLLPTDGNKTNNANSTPTPFPQKQAVAKNSIFVPYWDLPTASSVSDYDELFYFGVSATARGVDKTDPGYAGLKEFSESAAGTDAYLTLRMLDTDENLLILNNKKYQERLIKETLELSKKYGFKGVVLDLELGVIPLSSVVEKINSFVADFHLSAQSNRVVFRQAIYGDALYRARPFDVKFLAENTDGLIIMAYDFHKASSDPGPNFPFSGKAKFGYDFQQMITDFLAVAPPDKITVVFGMYGYDWITTVDGKYQQAGKALSLADITDKYLNTCDWKKCVVQRHPQAGEMEISYVDSTSSSNLIYHTIWYEDAKSVETKKEFLMKKGVGSIAYWAYGYF